MGAFIGFVFIMDQPFKGQTASRCSAAPTGHHPSRNGSLGEELERAAATARSAQVAQATPAPGLRARSALTEGLLDLLATFELAIASTARVCVLFRISLI